MLPECDIFKKTDHAVKAYLSEFLRLKLPKQYNKPHQNQLEIKEKCFRIKVCFLM